MYNTNDIITNIKNSKNVPQSIPPELLNILKSKAESPMWSGNISINDSEKRNVIPLEKISGLRKNIILLQAGTGSGKSLNIAPYLMQKGNNVILTQPRVLTTKNIATRMAEELGESIGNRINYITGSSKIVNTDNSGNKVMVITEGVLLKQLFSDSFNIKKYDYILIDEVHERNIETDLIIYKLQKMQNSGVFKGKIIIMSATLDIPIFEQYFGKNNVDVVKISGIQPEIQVNFLEHKINNYYLEIVNTVNHINNDANNDDILVFLPSKFALSEVRSLLNTSGKSMVILLYSGVPVEEENLVSATLPERYKNRIILATDVAETGITFPNLKYVIDSGWRNKPYYDPYYDCKMLIMDTITQSQALQRWGRVGRRFPGIVHCIYTKKHFEQMDTRGVDPENIKKILGDDSIKNNNKNPSGEPPVITNNVESLTLMMLNEDENAKLINNPTFEGSLRSVDILNKLGAIDNFGKITIIGKLMNQFKYSALESKLLCVASAHRCIEEIIIIIAMKFIGLDKLINVQKQRMLMINEYYSDHVNYYLIYKKYQAEKYNYKWLQDNDVNVEAFDMVDSEILNIKQKINQLGIPYFPKKYDKLNEMVSRIKNCLFRNMFYNLAIKIEKDGNIYYQVLNRPEIIANVGKSVAFTRDFPSADKLFPKYIVFEELVFISGMYSLINASSIPTKIINSTKFLN